MFLKESELYFLLMCQVLVEGGEEYNKNTPTNYFYF